MSDYPQTLMPGDHITKTWIDQLLRALRRQRPLPGPGVRTKVTPNGTVLTAKIDQPKATKAETPTLFPFKVRFAPSDEEGAGPRDGSFLVYVPDGSLSVDGHTAGGADFALEEREGEAGWFVLPTINLDAELWISFEYSPAEDPPLQCGVGTSPTYENPDDAHGTIARSVHIADVEFPEDAPPKVTQVTRGPLSYEFFVDSLNGMMGDLRVAADPDASVSVDGTEIFASVTTDKETGKILVGLSTSKPDDDDGEGDDCVHPGSHGEGGVPADDADAHGWGPGIGGGSGDSGVPADDNHGNVIQGKPCNCG